MIQKPRRQQLRGRGQFFFLIPPPDSRQRAATGRPSLQRRRIDSARTSSRVSSLVLPLVSGAEERWSPDGPRQDVDGLHSAERDARKSERLQVGIRIDCLRLCPGGVYIIVSPAANCAATTLSWTPPRDVGQPRWVMM